MLLHLILYSQHFCIRMATLSIKQMPEIISRFNILNQKGTQTNFGKLGNNFIFGVVVKLVVVK